MNELKKLGKESVHMSDHDEIIKLLNEQVHEGDIVLTLGAGNVNKISNKIKEMSK